MQKVVRLKLADIRRHGLARGTVSAHVCGGVRAIPGLLCSTILLGEEKGFRQAHHRGHCSHLGPCRPLPQALPDPELPPAPHLSSQSSVSMPCLFGWLPPPRQPSILILIKRNFKKPKCLPQMSGQGHMHSCAVWGPWGGGFCSCPCPIAHVWTVGRLLAGEPPVKGLVPR